jgi:hypothetical protein
MTEEIRGPAERPRNKVEKIGDAALKAIEKATEQQGGTLQEAMVLVHVEGVGLPDSVVCGQGFDSARDLFAVLITETVAVGKQLGMTVKVLPLGSIGHD